LKLDRESLTDRLVFLGTAGARYAAFGFLRQAGGLYFGFESSFTHVDPGPGAFVHAHRKGIDPHWTETVILSHRHLDHCADVNHVLEAMTLGGKKKRGELLCPSDAISQDPVVLEFVRRHLKGVKLIEEGLSVDLGGVEVNFPVKNIHGVETYGLKFFYKGVTVAYTSDTKFFDALFDVYRGSELLIVNTTTLKKNPFIEHLSAEEAELLIGEVRPELAILTHFGRSMLSAKPWEVAKAIEERTGVKTVAAYDNMVVDILNLEPVRQR